MATYQQIALAVGNPLAVRAIGNALHKNLNPQAVPCHRVVNAEGKVSSNYAFGGATAQRIRLESEGVCFETNDTISLALYGIEKIPSI